MAAEQHIPHLKPIITTSIYSGFVRLHVRAEGLEAVQIYFKKIEDSQFQTLAIVTDSPFDHHIVADEVDAKVHLVYYAKGILAGQLCNEESEWIEVVFEG
jgi:hypothetical protein